MYRRVVLQRQKAVVELLHPPPGPREVPKELHLVVFTGIYGYLRAFTGIYGHLLAFTGIYGHLRAFTVFTGIYGYLRAFTGIYGQKAVVELLHPPPGPRQVPQELHLVLEHAVQNAGNLTICDT